MRQQREKKSGKASNIGWTKYITRRLAVQVALAWNFGWGEAMRRVYGVSVKRTLVFGDSQKTEYFVDQKEFKKYVSGLGALLDETSFLSSFHKQARTKLENILKQTKRLVDCELMKYSNSELAKLYTSEVLPQAAQFYVRMWTVFNIGEPLADLVQRKLTLKIKDKKELQSYLLRLSSPLVPNDVIDERMDLLEIAVAKSRLSAAQLKKRLRKHWICYRHIPMFDFDHEPYELSHFAGELKKIKYPDRELAEIKKLFSGRRREFQSSVRKLQPDRKFVRQLEFLKENVWLRDYRDMLRQKYNLALRKFYSEIGRRIGLTVEEVARLTDKEIENYLKADKKFPREEIKKRQSAFLLIQEGSTVRIYSGREARAMAREELKPARSMTAKQITGITGSVGRARGRVRIVYTNRDLPKVRPGDIIVASMTRQDFVPALRKAAAVVTDEGSVTCHAAVIARELGIPCLVATKIGTKVLHDNDKLEVDTERGVARVLK